MSSLSAWTISACEKPRAETDDYDHVLQEDLENHDQAQDIQTPMLCRGMRFARAEDLRAAVEHFYASQGKGVKHGQGGSRQREFRCSGSRIERSTREHVGCLAFIRATKQANDEWRISSMETSHKNCIATINYKVSVAKAVRIASRILATTPRVTARELKSEIENQTGGILSLRSAYRAKRAALRGRRMALTEEYSCLRSYLTQLEAMSPGTITNCEVSKASGRLPTMTPNSSPARVG